MAKFCGKCGTKLDETTGLCPKCDADKMNKQTELPKSVEEPKPKQDMVSEPKKSLSKKEVKKQRKADKKAAKKDKKAQKKAIKKEKWKSKTLLGKMVSVITKLLAWLLVLIVLITVALLFFPGYYMLNGETGEDLGFSVFTENCIQFDGKNFYVTGMSNYDDGGVYSCKAGNTETCKKLSDIHPTRLLLQGDYLYVMSNYSSINNLPNDYYGTWRINTNGKNAISLFDFCPNYLVFSGNQIFYTNEDRIVCSADLDGSNEMVFEGAVVNGGLNVSDHYIFFISAETKTIWRMDKDGNNLIELNNDSTAYEQCIVPLKLNRWKRQFLLVLSPLVRG